MAKLTGGQIKDGLKTAPQWKKKGSTITRTFEFKDFLRALKFVNAVAKPAEKMQHHPDIDIRWNKVSLALSTHDQGGLTEKDFEMAKKIDAIPKM